MKDLAEELNKIGSSLKTGATFTPSTATYLAKVITDILLAEDIESKLTKIKFWNKEIADSIRKAIPESLVEADELILSLKMDLREYLKIALYKAFSKNKI